MWPPCRSPGEHAPGGAVRLGTGPSAVHLPVRLPQSLLHSERDDHLRKYLLPSGYGGGPLPAGATVPARHPRPHPSQPHSALASPLPFNGSLYQWSAAAQEANAHAGTQTAAGTAGW